MNDRTIMYNDKPCRHNADGAPTPENKIKPIDLARDDLVYTIALRAKGLSNLISTYKADAASEIIAFVDLSALEYNIHLGGKKGNVTLYSFDKRYKVERQISDYIVFDERLQVAHALITECINEWSQDVNDNIKALVGNAFQTDKKGEVSTSRVLGLRSLKITDEKWLKAMEAIADSMTTNASKTYIRIYERQGDDNEYVPIVLNAAAA